MRWTCALLVLCVVHSAHGQVQVRVEGVQPEIEANVRQHLGIARFAQTPGLTETNIRALHQRAPEQISAASAPYGYYDPQVQARLESQGDNGWLATYIITPGTAVRVASIDVVLEGAGENEVSLRKASSNPGIAPGDVLVHARYETLKERLLEAALARGFRNAQFVRNRLEVDREAHQANIELTLQTGERYRFGEVTFQSDVIAQYLLRRYPAFTEGDLFDAGKLIDLQYALYDSQYFATVAVQPMSAQDFQVPINVSTTAGKKRKLGAGIGYGTDTGARFSASYLNRRLNRRGHRIGVDLSVSEPRTEFTAQFLKPLDRPATDRMTYALGVLQETLGDTDSEVFSASAVQTRRLGNWQRRLYTEFSRQFDQTGDEELRTTLLVPGTTWTRTISNAVTFPTRGSFLEADLHGAVQGIAADTSFARLQIETRFIRPAVGKDRIIMRLSAGTSVVDEFSELPATERFFAGGDQSVRGFSLNELGPTDQDGLVIGGRHLLTGSVEYERRLIGNWALAFFADAGNAFDDFNESFEYAAGIGLRWLSPIGMVRLDVAQPLSLDEDDDLHVHFSFGPEI